MLAKNRPWTLATAAFCEASLIEVCSYCSNALLMNAYMVSQPFPTNQFVFSVVSLVLAGKYLERVWGFNGFILFVLATVVGSNVIACAVNVLEHFVLQDSGMLLWVHPLRDFGDLRAHGFVADLDNPIMA
jgi:hypothetical protein